MALDFFGLFMLPGSEFVWGLILGIVPEIVVGMVLWNKRLRKSLRKDIRGQLLSDVNEGLLDPAIERATSGVNEGISDLKNLVGSEDLKARILQVQTRLEEVDQSLEARLQEISLEPVQAKLEELDQSLEARLQEISLEPVQAKLEELDVALGGHLQAIQERMANLEDTLPGRVRSSLEGARGSEIKEIQKAAEAAESTAVELYEAELEPSERLLARFDQMNPSPKWQQEHQVGNMIIQGVKEMVREQIVARRGDVVTMKRVEGPRGKGFPTVYGGR